MNKSGVACGGTSRVSQKSIFSGMHILFLILLGLIISIPSVETYANTNKTTKKVKKKTVKKPKKAKKKRVKKKLPPYVSSKYAALVIDAHTGKVLFSRNPTAKRYPASLTKIMTLYMVFDELKKGRLSLDSDLIVTKFAASQPPSKIGLKPRSRLKVIDAVRALVAKSANDVAVTVAENLAGTQDAFGEAMTRKARELGMKNTVFRNASGLPNPQQVTTAQDMIILAQRMQADFPEYYHFFKTKFFAYKGRKYKNHNRLLFSYQGADGIKTGYIRASGFNLVSSVRRRNKHLLAVVMGGRSSKARNAHMTALLNRTMPRAIARKSKPKPKQKIQIAKVVHAPPAKQITAVPSANNQLSLANQAYQANSFSANQGTPRYFSGQSVTKPLPQGLTQPQARQNNINNTGPFHIQVGAYSGIAEAQAKLVKVKSNANDLLRGHPPMTIEVQKTNGQIVRARFASFSKVKAQSTCQKLKKRSIDCIVMRAE